MTCLSCLSVCGLVYCGQTVGWIKMPLGTEVGFDPGDIVVDGDPAHPTERGVQQPPLFGSCLLWPNGRPSQQLLSSCSQNGCRSYDPTVSYSSPDGTFSCGRPRRSPTLDSQKDRGTLTRKNEIFMCRYKRVFARRLVNSFIRTTSAVLWVMVLSQKQRQNRTSSSAAAERPREPLSQLKSCQLLHNCTKNHI